MLTLFSNILTYLLIYLNSSLLSLIPPSYMVVPNRELVNKPFFNSSTSSFSFQTNNLLTVVDLFNNIEMDILKGRSSDNYDEVRGRSHSCSLHSSRDNSMISTTSSKPYHQRMEENNGMNINDINNTPSELSYETSQEREICLRAVAENSEDMLPSQGKLTNTNHLQHGPEKIPDSTSTWGSTAQNEESAFINIPLLYDPNTPADPEIWDGNFHLISLYGSIEHLGSDIKSIKNSLRFMTKYITNKQIESSKANNLDDFKGIEEAVWNFISSVYKAN